MKRKRRGAESKDSRGGRGSVGRRRDGEGGRVLGGRADRFEGGELGVVAGDGMAFAWPVQRGSLGHRGAARCIFSLATVVLVLVLLIVLINNTGGHGGRRGDAHYGHVAATRKTLHDLDAHARDLVQHEVVQNGL